MVDNLLIILAAASAALLAAMAARDLLRQRRRRGYSGLLADRRPGASRELEEPEAPLGPVERRLRAAGLRRLSLLTFLATAALFAVLAGLAFRAILPPTPLATVFGAGLAVFLLWLLLGAWGRQRARRFEQKLVDALALMVGALRAGENLTQAFASTAEATEGAVSREFRNVANRLGLGMGIRQALRPIEQGYDSEGTRFFTKTIIAKWQAGGDLTPILDSVARVLRDRLRIRWRVQSHLAGARMALVMVAVLPYLLIPVYLWWQPELFARFRVDPWGPKLLLGAVALQLLGILWMRRVMRIEL